MPLHVRRALSAIAAASLAATLSIGAATAQDESLEPEPTPSQFCTALTADEVSAALDATLTVTTSSAGDTSCSYETDYATGTFLSLFTSVDSSSIDDIKGIWTDGQDIDVAGAPGYYLPDTMGSLMWVQLPTGGTFNLQLVGTVPEGVDLQAALTGLAGLALPRLAAMPLPTTVPVPSFATDAELQALFPTEIGGHPVTVFTAMGGGMLGTDPSDPTTQGVIDVLATQGKTLDDVSIGFGTVTGAEGSQGIIAIRVRGADIAALQDPIVQLFLQEEDNPQQSAANIAGKDVTAITADGETAYVYPRNDVLWLVSLQEPGLTEVFQKLP